MDVKMRVHTCTLLEQIKRSPDFARKIGLENASAFTSKMKEKNTRRNQK